MATQKTPRGLHDPAAFCMAFCVAFRMTFVDHSFDARRFTAR